LRSIHLEFARANVCPRWDIALMLVDYGLPIFCLKGGRRKKSRFCPPLAKSLPNWLKIAARVRANGEIGDTERSFPIFFVLPC
jgi:hypothetical protein